MKKQFDLIFDNIKCELNQVEKWLFLNESNTYYIEKFRHWMIFYQKSKKGGPTDPPAKMAV